MGMATDRNLDPAVNALLSFLHDGEIDRLNGADHLIQASQPGTNRAQSH
jgi:hypothetical protein